MRRCWPGLGGDDLGALRSSTTGVERVPKESKAIRATEFPYVCMLSDHREAFWWLIVGIECCVHKSWSLDFKFKLQKVSVRMEMVGWLGETPRPGVPT